MFLLYIIIILKSDGECERGMKFGVRQSHICSLGKPEGDDGEDGGELIVEEEWLQVFQNCRKNRASQVQEAQHNPNYIETKF